jgi:hypothetical protein
MTVYQLNRRPDGLIVVQALGGKAEPHYSWTVEALVDLAGEVNVALLRRSTGLPTIVWAYDELYYCDGLHASTLEALLQVILRGEKWTK